MTVPRSDGGGPVARPGGSTAAAMLACVQAGVTSIATVLVFADAVIGEGGQVPIGVVQVAGVALLIVGAARLVRGGSRVMLIVGCALELGICVYYLFRYSASESGEVGGASGVLLGIPVLFAIMPVISLMLLRSRQTSHVDRLSGARTAAAVLAFVHAGVTLIITGILLTGLALSDADTQVDTSANTAAPLLSTDAGDVMTSAGPGELWIVSIAQLVGVGLLIRGGVRLVSGRAGALFPIAAGLQVVLCAYWLIRGSNPAVPVILVVLPLVALILAHRTGLLENEHAGNH